MPFGGLINEKLISGERTPSPELSQRILHANQRRQITFDQ
jgi:hypothetical protein